MEEEKRNIKYGGFIFEKEEREAVNRVLDRNWWGLDIEGEAFEKELAEYLGVKYAVFTNSGSSALLLIFQALRKVLPFYKREIIVPATCFPTAISSIMLSGFEPVVVDVSLRDFLIDVKEVRKAINSSTAGILAVHTAGNVCDLEQLTEICEENGLVLIEDNCDGLGGKFNGKMVGSFGISAASFHAAHIICTGQGGAVFTNNKVIAKIARSKRDWGRMVDFDDEAEGIPPLPEDYMQRYTYTELGFNLNPIELQAAIGREQLKKIDRFLKARKRNFEYLAKALKEKGYIVPEVHPLAEPAWFTVPLLVPEGVERKKVFQVLKDAGIEFRNILASNITLHRPYMHLKRLGNLENANVIARKGFWIPCHPSLKKRDLNYIIETLWKV